MLRLILRRIASCCCCDPRDGETDSASTHTAVSALPADPDSGPVMTSDPSALASLPPPASESESVPARPAASAARSVLSAAVAAACPGTSGQLPRPGSGFGAVMVSTPEDPDSSQRPGDWSVSSVERTGGSIDLNAGMEEEPSSGDSGQGDTVGSSGLVSKTKTNLDDDMEKTDKLDDDDDGRADGVDAGSPDAPLEEGVRRERLRGRGSAGASIDPASLDNLSLAPASHSPGLDDNN